MSSLNISIDIDTDDNDFVCLDHRKTFEIICHQCNLLLCSKCSTDHNKQYEHNSFCDHINDIKQSLYKYQSHSESLLLEKLTTENNNNKNNNSKSIFEKNRILEVWETIKSSNSYFRKLESTESEIKDHFHQMHQYLVVEEQRYQQPIQESKSKTLETIKNNIEELKHIVNIINLEGSTRYESDIDQSSDKSDEDDYNNSADTTDSYSIESIMESLDRNHSLLCFIESKDKTVFDISGCNGRSSYKDIESLILHSIQMYNQQFKKSYVKPNPPPDYQLYTEPINTTMIKQVVDQSINLSIKQPSHLKNIYSIPGFVHSPPLLPDTHLFFAHQDKGAIIWDFRSKTSKYLHFDFDFTNTQSSIVSVGEHLYVFGGSNNLDKYMIISKKTLKGKIHMLPLDDSSNSWISACHDGKNHIYLVKTLPKLQMMTITLYDIKSMKFEQQHRFIGANSQIMSVFYNGLFYSFSKNQDNILILDPIKGTHKFFKTLKFKETLAACTDGVGNVFLHSEELFIRINLDHMKLFTLSPVKINSKVQDNAAKPQTLSMTYYRSSDKEHFIFLFGSPSTQRYSIETNTWLPDVFSSYQIYKNSLCPTITYQI
ncbi:hypothetical protein PPL_03963 [Heterostelium album PN500]|uniref:B box-type domain-containing protein n=1 Tax=Heterostelium pallidum (strain ATCC 26659 / Pp 5 / PN500) TaxID=670386 RepID=D3B5M5_HETP5|nr:hypothetical protein PPL_03963 [Heterostelium album PN500]EFA83173.1 hypothetical protein PPL_03963 [Heterostelium album PN500]|eukprot:XP_020435290.1 hypothetical protein PPL_03963 [Heterostelium album PN500]